MNIFALSTENSNFKDLTSKISEIVPVDLFTDSDTLLLAVSESAAVLLDLDTDQKKVDKLIKQVRKADPEVPVFVYSTQLDAKQMTKHQKSKSSAELYLSADMDEEVLQLMLGEYFDFEGGPDSASNEIVSKHEESISVSEGNQELSEKIDDVFSGVFVDEYTGDDDSNDDSEAVSEQPLEEFSMEDDGGVDEFSLDGDEGVDMSEEDELNIGEGTSEDDDLSFSLDDEFSEEIDTSVELSLNDNEEQVNSDEFSLEGDLELGGEEQASEMSLELGDDEPAQSIEDNGGDLSLGDFTLDSDEVLELGDDSASSEDLSGLGDIELSEDSSDQSDDLDINPEPQTTPSLVFDLSSDDNDIEDALNLSSDSQSGSDEDVNTNAAIVTGLDLEEELSVDSDTDLDSLFSDELSEDDVEASLEASISNDDEEDKTIVGVGLAEELALQNNADADVTQTRTKLLASEIPLGDDLDLFSEPDNSESENDVSFTLSDVEQESELESELEEDDEHAFVDEKTVVGVLSDDNFDDEKTIVGKSLPDESPDFEDEISQNIENINQLVPEETQINTDEVEEHFEQEDEPEQAVFSEEKTKTRIDSEVIKNYAPVEDQIKEDHQAFVRNHSEELVRMGETIQNLREDREMLIAKISMLEESHHRELNDFLGLKAQLDESKIEVEVLKKRYSDQLEDLKLRYDLASDKKAVLETKNRYLQEEFDRLSRDKRVDINNIKHRERELEEKLELLRADAEIQIRNRDHKILDLKRRIDTLEFDIENAHMSEKRAKSGSIELEEKMNQVIRTLRGAITQLEDETELEKRRKIIKDNLDV